MPVEITMPQLSDTMTEGTVVKWSKKEGDKVKSGEEIAEVETDKAVMPMEAFEGGTLAHISVPEGGKVAVGGVIGYLATGKEDPAAIKKQFAGGKASAAPAKSEAKPAAKEPVKTPAKAVSAAAREESPAASATAVAAAASDEIHEPDHVGHGATRERATPVPSISGNGNRVFASPLARRIAADKNIDLSTLKGTGPNGRIVQVDVENAINSPAPTKAHGPSLASPPPARVPSGQKEVIPLTKLRSVIAQRLQMSKQQIPHFYETIDIDVTEVAALRERMNKQLESEKIRLSIGDIVAKAVASTLVRHPAVNAHFKETEIHRFGDVNLGMAVALPEGLIVPVLRNINQMGLKEIRQRSADLVDRARAQRLKQDEMTGATFTVSNLGTYGLREFSAIVNPPEVGILAIGAAEPRPVVRNNQVVARTMMTVTLSADHRAVDGATAADFLRTLKSLLEEPAMMLV